MKPACVLAGLVAFTSVLLGASPTSAEQAPPAPRPVTEAVRVNVVNVEVLATGKDGQPVLDLKPEEFELYEDGEIVRLTNFLAPALAFPAGAPEPPPTGPAAEIAAVSQEEQQRTLVLFIDNLNLTHLTRSLVLDQLGRFLDEQLRNGYREVVLAFGLSLRKLTPLTSDPTVVAAALTSLRKAVSEGTMVRAQRDRTLADMSRGAATAAGPMGDLARQDLVDEAAMSGQEQAYLQRRLLETLLSVVDSLSGVPGRKALLYVSEGIPVNPGSDMLEEAGARFGGAGSTPDSDLAQGLRSRLREVTRHANAGRITFYTINVPPPGGSVTAETRAPSLANVDSIDTMNREQSLTQLTVATGGRKLYNADMLQTMTKDLEAYYSLGYSPSHFGDGKYHRLSVTVKRTGVSIRAREGYLDKTPEQRQADRTTAGLLGGGNSNPLEARVELGKPQPQGRRKVAVPLTLFIPAANLVLVPAGDSHEGKVSIAIAVAKSDGKRSEVHRQTFPIKVPSRLVAAFLRQSTRFTFTLIVEPGDATVSVSARDEVAQVDSVVVADLVASAGGS
jgi:VWFA-related protein